MLTDHYVYAIKDSIGDIIYIGEGRADRLNSKHRNRELTHFLKSEEYYTEKISEGLSKDCSRRLEKKLILEIKPKFNKVLPNIPEDLTLEFCSKYFKINLDNPTLLAWNIDIYSGKNQSVHSVKVGSPAGFKTSSGDYYRVTVNAKMYFVHRILWVLYHQKDLDRHLVIDHLDHNGLNNTKENIRACSQKENSWNLMSPAKGSSGVFGVSIKTSLRGIQSYYATVRHDGILYEKGFSTRKYGRDLALKLAEDWRNNKLTELGR